MPKTMAEHTVSVCRAVRANWSALMITLVTTSPILRALMERMGPGARPNSIGTGSMPEIWQGPPMVKWVEVAWICSGLPTRLSR